MRDDSRGNVVSAVTGDRIELDQSAVGSVDGERVELRQTAAQNVRGDSLDVAESAVLSLRGTDVQMRDCGAGVVVAEHVTMRESGTLLLVARSVDGQVRGAITPAAALAFGAGLAIGIPLALVGSGYVKSLLFEVEPNDPVALIIAVTTLLACGLLAAFAPARRASLIDPMRAVREE